MIRLVVEGTLIHSDGVKNGQFGGLFFIGKCILFLSVRRVAIFSLLYINIHSRTSVR